MKLICSKCRSRFPATSFPKTKYGKPDSRCRGCKYKSESRDRKLLRTYKSKELNRERVLNRSLTKSRTKGMKFVCSIFNCEAERNIELHHVSYDDCMCFVPLCKKHHVMNHAICGK